MRNFLTILIALFAINLTSAQFYIAPSIGYGIGSAGILTGTSLNESQTKASNHYGSYGEGMTVQLRGGYFFNDTFGIELGVGYLQGADQNISSYEATDNGIDYTEGFAHGEAYGINIALAYNFNEHFYGKIGMISKLGGKTEATFTSSTQTPLSPAGIAPIITEGVNDYHGRLPLGFTGAFGYKHSLGGNWHAFAELEYLGINVKRDNSEFAKLSITTPEIPAGVVGPSAIPSMTWNLGDAPLAHPVFGTIAAPSEITYVDELPEPNTDPSKALSSVVPYSSFGLNIGVRYTFNKK